MTVTASKYAKVLWELAMPEEALKTAGELLAGNPALYAVLNDPAVHKEQKHKAADRIFPPEAVNFIKFLCDEGDLSYFSEICEAYEQLKNEKNKTVTAKLLYVTPPGKAQEEGMKDFLRNYFQAKNVVLEQIRDKSLLGGFILSARNREWDWSLRGRIARMSKDLSRR